MRGISFSSLRVRLLLLILLTSLPAIGLMLHSAAEQRRNDAVNAQKETLRLLGQVSREQEVLINSTRELLTVISQLPAVRSGDSAACGMLLAALDLTWLNKLAAEAKLPPGATLTVIDRKGMILSSYPDGEKWVGKMMSETPIIQTVLSKGEGTVETAGMDGKTRLYAFRPLHDSTGDSNIYIYSGIPSEIVFNGANQMMIRNLAGIGVSTILVLIIAWWGGSLLFLRRVNALLGVAQRLATGDLSARSGLSHTKGELGRLAQTFDEMAKVLEQRTTQLHKSEDMYRTIFETTGTATVIIDNDTIICLTNKEFEKLSGFPEQDLQCKKSLLEFFTESDSEKIMGYHRARRTGSDLAPRIYEARFIDRRGNIKDVMMMAALIPGTQKSVLSMMDITERKRAERRAGREVARVKLLADISQELAKAGINYQAVFRTVAGCIVESIGDACVIRFLSEDGQYLDAFASDHNNPEAKALLRNMLTNGTQHIDEGLNSKVMQTGQPLLIPVVQPEQLQGLTKPDYQFYLERFGISSALIVPLYLRNRVIGTLGIYRDNTGQPYTGDDLAFLQDLVDRISLAINNAELYGENLLQLKSLSALYDSAQKFGQSLDLKLLSEDIACTCVEQYEASLAWIGRAEEDGSVRAMAQYPLESKYPRDIKVRWDGSVLGQGATGRAIRTGSPVVITDVSSDSDLVPWRESLLKEGICSRAAFPLVSRNKNFGILNLYSDKPGYFTPGRVEFFRAFANQAAVALENARLYEEARRRSQQLQALRSIDMAITASLDIRVTFNVILDQVINQLVVDASDILLLNQHTRTLEFAAGRGFRSKAIERSRLRLGEGVVGRAVLQQQIINVSDPDGAGVNSLRAPLLDGEDFIAYYGVPLITKGQVKGLLEIFHRGPLDPDRGWLDFLEALGGQAAIAIDNAALFDDLQRSNIELTLAYDATIEGLSYALDLRDKETEGHSRRVTEKTLSLARAMGLSDAELVHVSRGALLHDIGKLGVPDHILLKPGPLTEEEWEIMRRHPTYAYEMLSPIGHLRPALDIPYCHHEKWDGTGYPRGLKGEQIPLAARVFAVVDVWDALRSDRPYRAAWPEEKVRDYLRQQAAKHFDPKVVEKFLHMQW